MNLKYFGDSYDIVKKSLLTWLAPFGPWGAYPMFTHEVAEAQANHFEAFLGVPLLSRACLTVETRQAYFGARSDRRSVFVDPDTGVRMDPMGGQASTSFVFKSELERLADEHAQGLLLVFDQSLARGRVREDLDAKLKRLRDAHLAGFAYCSHASFLILGRDAGLVREARSVLLDRSKLPPAVILSTDESSRSTHV